MQPHRTCSVPGCDRPPRTGKAEWCNRCYLRWWKYGDPSTKPKRRHGHTWTGGTTPEYAAWAGMRQRCLNPNDSQYHYYGGRGIKVCERWASFEAFFADVGPRPSPKHSIDRINNNGDYEPGNVRWATVSQQQRNTRARKRVTFRGESLLIVEWAERLGLSQHLIYRRIWIAGWSVEDALTIPPLRRGLRAR
jgi:hypothetical protein